MADTFNSKLVSIVIPVYNERDSVSKLHSEIRSAFAASPLPIEIIFVDDGSSDGALAELEKIEKIRVIALPENLGQTLALHTGIQASVGEVVVTLDGDGQNDPLDIDAAISRLGEGYDLVCGWRHLRKDSLSKKITSRLAYGARKAFFGDTIHDSGCGLKAIRGEHARRMNLPDITHRMIPLALSWQGLKVTEVRVNHRPRVTGKTKYGISRIFFVPFKAVSVWLSIKYNIRINRR